MDTGAGLTAAVIITAIVGIFTLIINRGSKISELRQAWINDQRSDLASWSAAALSLARQKSSDRSADYNKLEEAAQRIRLRENPVKREWKDVLDLMDDVRAQLLNNEARQIEILAKVTNIAEGAQDRLKKDWNRVRNGEPGYMALCLLFPSLFGVLLVMAVWAFVPGWNPFSTKPDRAVEQHVTGSLSITPAEAPRTREDIRPPASQTKTLDRLPKGH